ncbi:probable helicase senataxin isoform X2 [Notechis scutatus]|uniref:Probable helicase senataxin isoform X2 n=1 Tax=Notechis scutatus TaxID=8663 RepID=A0A6J1VSZ9_9SAUR|nr:probable helicase senataxin isoform X2 [Notechis scutatus]
MEEMNYFYQVVGKHPGIYLLMVHPNETIRQWAILTARNLGKVDRDDYYDIQEVLICLFKVIELGLFENPDIYSSLGVEKTRLVLLPPHLYDTGNYKNYWLGLCMLLSVLEEQAMDSLMLGPDKQNFMQSIMNIMKKQTDGEINDPFWPVLQCFMVILDKLGSKVWGQLADPVRAFQAIISNASYKKEIESIRQNSTKSEPPSDYEDVITCSQIVYNYNPERLQQDSRLRTTACLDYCPNFYEEMQTLTDMFQYDMGRDMRLHYSTFLWFIPFFHSLMDLKELGVAYSIVVIQHLCSEVKEVLHHADQPCDKVSQFFIWILVAVVELSLKKKCFNPLWASSQNWVEVVVVCAGLPSMAFPGGAERDMARNGPRRLTKVPSWEPDSIQSVCMNLIRVLLKEGYQMGRKASLFLDELNLLRRSHEDWNLSPQQAQELQTCLIDIIGSLWAKSSSASSHGEHPTSLIRGPEGKSPGYLPQEESLCEKKYSLDEEAKGSICGEQSHQKNSELHLTDIKQEAKQGLMHEDHILHSTSTGGPNQNNGSFHSILVNQNSSLNQSSFDKDVQKKEPSGKEEKLETANADFHQKPSSSVVEENQIPKTITEKIESNKADLNLKLKQFVESRKWLLRPESEKQQSCKEEKQDHQEGTSRSTSRDGSSTSSWLPCKPSQSSENGFQAEILSIKKEPRDSLAEFKRTWKSGEDSEESSTGDDLNVPLTEVREELVRKKSVVQATEPEVDREDRLYLADRQESNLNPIQRKVQGACTSLSESKGPTLSPGTGGPSSQVIIISDTSSDEEENKVNLSRRSQEEKVSSGSLQKDHEANKQEVITASNSPLMYGECESQCFEFETEDEIYSFWQDSQLDKTAEADVLPGKAAGRSDLALARCLSEQDDDTDCLGDDVIEKAAQELEQQVEVGKAKPKLPVQANEENVSEGSTTVCSKYFTATHDDGRESPRQSSASASPKPLLPSASGGSLTPSLEPAPGPRKSLAKSKCLNTAPPRPEERRPVTEKESAHETLPGSPRPFVVPPKKVHHFPEPTSTVEKLGLKKKPRKAAELSQRSHDVLAQLRSHGKTAGQLPQKNQKRRKAKLIEPRRMLIQNKALLASQERQFFRQSRSEKKKKGEEVPRAKKPLPKATVESTAKKVVDNPKGKPSQCKSSSNQLKKSLPQHSREDDGSHSASLEREGLPSSRQETLNPDSAVPGCSTSAPGSVCSSSGVSGANSGSSFDWCNKNTSENASGLKEDLDLGKNEEDLFLTQRDPVDMELCSLMESSSSSEDGDVLPTLQDQLQAVEKGRHPGCPKTAEGAQVHPLPNPPDHVFAKPCMFAKLSTKKTFTSVAASRIASLSKDIETSSVQAKTKSSLVHFAALKADGMRPKLTLANLLGPRNGNNLSTQPYSVQNSHLVSTRSDTGQETRPSFAQVNSSHNQPRDHSIFTKEILKWSYDMFANFRELGPPNHLLQAVVNSVPVKFQNYDDYFKTFFPLMMLNAFEEVTCEWLDNQKLKNPKPFHLTLLNFNMDLNKADFTAKISQHEIENQQYPKEDDVVFLIVSDKQFYYDEQDRESHVVRHVGFVTRFSQPSSHNTKKKEQQVTCHLSIQTQGNLARVEKNVKCMVVSSLATTHRRFQALLMLNRSPLAMPILSPSVPYFSPRDLNTESEKSLPYMKDFNEGQKQAIESAYAMITQHPSSPKVCLIHGPPGTGKSKVIVGLLHRILDERSGKENSIQRLNAKIKTNRILVCAPSNAAIDNLMKKIILEFKKFREKNALGNCGDINLVRLGQLKSINSEVRKFSLDDQIDRKINKAMLGKDQDLQKKKEDLDRRLDALSRLRAVDRSVKGEKKQQLEDEICQLSKERERLGSQLKEARGRSQELKSSIILESHIICCTLSTSGGLLLKSAFRRLGGDPVSCVIVDEAGQTCEVETLIPLIHGCKKLVLVGDPKQLPPTIKSLRAQDYRYDQSLIGRLCKHLKEQDQENISGKFPVLQLTVQYRMHPEICHFPSRYIYEGLLTTDGKIEEDRFSLAWPFQPYVLFDVSDSREERENDSYCNPQEVMLLAELMKVIKGRKKDISSRQIGIITPYNAQKRRIQKQLDREFGENSVGEVDTVDGFQGREKDCIIVTCVRANSPQGSIGFLKSLQRLNVTITRAKYSLFILGKLKTLMENGDWNEMIQDAQRRGNIVRTSEKTYKTCATKILKSRLLSRAGVAANLQRGAHEVPAAPGRAKPQALLPSPAPLQRPPIPLPTLAGKRTPQETLNHWPPPVAQVKPIQDRPQDPRLLRHAKTALKAPNHQEGRAPALGPSSAPKSGPCALQSRSNSAGTRGETPSRVTPVPVPPLPSSAPPSTKAFDQRRYLLNWKNHPSYPGQILEAPQEKDDPVEPKRRRTTF